MSIKTDTAEGKAQNNRKTFGQQTSVSTNINARPEVIWALLTNGGDYNRWNSTIISLEGDIESGNKIVIKVTLDPKRSFKLKVSKMTDGKCMVWESGMAPFFKGVRTYELTEMPNGNTRFSMVEKMGGLMFPMAAGQLPDLTASFQQFAADLKNESEIIAK